MTDTDRARAWSPHATRSTRAQEVLCEWRDDAERRLRLSDDHIEHCLAAVWELCHSARTEDLADITTDHALAWLAIQPSAKTACNKRCAANTVFRYAVLRQALPRNPLHGVTLPRPRCGRGADSMTPEEVARVISVARRGGDKRSTGEERARFYLFLWATALRVSEASDQLWRDIHWRESAMRVSRDKSKRSDVIPLPAWLLVEMQRWPREGDCIFQRIPSHHTLVRDFDAAKVHGRGNWHRFRKGAITHLANSGVPIPVLARLSRHRNISVLVNSYITTEWSQLTAAQSLMAI